MASANDLRALRGNEWAYAHGANVAPPTRVHDELEEVSSRCNTSSCESPFRDARLRALQTLKERQSGNSTQNLGVKNPASVKSFFCNTRGTRRNHVCVLEPDTI